MKIINIPAILLVAASLSACSIGANKGVDGQVIDRKPLSNLTAGIWVDPNGCDHWLVDDGIEGYLDLRVDRSGKQVCSGIENANTVRGNYKSSGVPDIL